ncbi:MAG: FKBP-type peptidyl-prolyl cis-trans isomerase [Bacteroidales bacterium]|nr:FKBP-type peptidyl-prolyl cis-trans isomerase [Bacteroidales bacterium]
MKKVLTLGLVLLFMGTTMSVKSQNAEMTKEQKISYAIGANLGRQVKQDGVVLDVESLAEGVRDAMAGQNKFTDQQMQEIFMQFQQDMQAKQANAAAEAKVAGTEFLKKNMKDPDVKVTASGLQYKVITMGNGPKPSATSEVTVKYTGTLIDGTVFDSTDKNGGEPISFGLNQVIKGWTEGLQLMPTGSKFIFYIPSELAYGDNGAGGVIPGGATLIFEIELLSFK